MITFLQSASYASTASLLPSMASNIKTRHLSSVRTQVDTKNNPSSSGFEELSLTPPRLSSISTAISAAEQLHLRPFFSSFASLSRSTSSIDIGTGILASDYLAAS